MEDTNINEGDRICQFEIKPTMFAPFLVKLKWLFSSGIEIIYIDDLNSDDRVDLVQLEKNNGTNYITSS